MATMLELLNRLIAGQDLDIEQAQALLDLVFEGQVPEAQVAAFLTALRIKPVTAPELAGLARSLRSHAARVDPGVGPLIDTCGTGAGKVKTCNVSTASALVAAGAGLYVAKHGNRGITSRCGSADVLEALGVKVDAGPDVVARCIREARIGFMFAPMFHPAMKYVQPVRKALGFRTVFNILGPLANPAGAQMQVLGVADAALMEPIAQTLQLLGCTRAWVVHSEGLDEISTAGPTQVIELAGASLTRSQINPASLGIPKAALEDLRVEDAQVSAKVLREILAGTHTGPKRDIVVLNAAAAIVVGGRAKDLSEGVALADRSIRTGQAMACLDRLIEVSKCS